ncbi:MAG: hypothetical protein WD356_08615 [Pseudomonadales bacterium]
MTIDPNIIYLLLADLLLVSHFAFVAFLVLGLVVASWFLVRPRSFAR